MLYTGDMSAKLNVPGEIFMGNKEYSWRMDWRVNGWLFVAALISGLADIVFRHATSHLPLATRAGIQAMEFFAIALWARSLVRWIGGMDEMHRRITLSAILFAVSATFFVLMLWHRLDAEGFFNVIFGVPKTGTSWDICTVCHGFLLMTLFYFLGHTVFNRRYR